MIDDIDLIAADAACALREELELMEYRAAKLSQLMQAMLGGDLDDLDRRELPSELRMRAPRPRLAVAA